MHERFQIDFIDSSFSIQIRGGVQVLSIFLLVIAPALLVGNHLEQVCKLSTFSSLFFRHRIEAFQAP
jgi:hypothetical protein